MLVAGMQPFEPTCTKNCSRRGYNRIQASANATIVITFADDGVFSSCTLTSVTKKLHQLNISTDQKPPTYPCIEKEDHVVSLDLKGATADFIQINSYFYLIAHLSRILRLIIFVFQAFFTCFSHIDLFVIFFHDFN